MCIRFNKKLICFLFVIAGNMYKKNCYVYYQYTRVASNYNLADNGRIYYKLNINNIILLTITCV